MASKSPGPQKCRLILNQTLAIQLSRPGNGNIPEDFWMYDSGYMVFQNFLAANSQFWWNASLIAATRALKYVGHIAPGMLLVTAEPCALEILRNAYSRSVLKPPSTYSITFVGDIDDCIVMPTVQGQFTPLPEALCDIIMDLTAQGQSATMENIRTKLTQRFSHMRAPSTEMVYDSLVQLNQERKIYQTAKGYFIVTPERRRSRSRPRDASSLDGSYIDEDHHPKESRTMLLSNSEALYNLYGEISTERDGDLTHQCIQTNLADVICGGNPNDKVMYARSTKRRSSSFPNRSLERRHSLRIFGSTKRLQRSTSTRSLSKNYSITGSPDSSSSEYQSTTEFGSSKGQPQSQQQQAPPQQRQSLLSRLFRRSGRQKTRQVDSYSAQFPPTEWFNSRTVHLHNVGTQTNDQDLSMSAILPNSTIYDGSDISQQSSTLPRRHRRHMSSESTFMIWSRDCSPVRRHSPHSMGSLPRSINSSQSGPNCRKSKSRSAEENAARAQQRHRLDEKINQEREKHFRSMQSGPSSLESGKTSALSGPSSIDSGKNSSSRTTSCMSSLESNGPPSMRSLRLNGGGANGSYGASVNHPKDDPFGMPSVITSSMSNNSITLQVTTTTGSGACGNSSQNGAGSFLNVSNHHHHNGSGLDSTKIYVQNSPARSVIKLENGKLADNANVVIINKNEMISGGSHKEVIEYNRLENPAAVARQQPLETQFDNANVVFHDKGPIFRHVQHQQPTLIKNPPVIHNQLNNLHQSDQLVDHGGATSPPRPPSSTTTSSMNNNQIQRKLSLQASNGTNLIYKNLLRQNSDRQHTPHTPADTKSDWYGGELDSYETCSLNNQVSGSEGSLGLSAAASPITTGDSKPLNNTGKSYSQNKLNETTATGDLFNGSLSTSNNYLSKLKSINSIDSLATIYQKKSTNLVTVGSEPNLMDLKVGGGGDKLHNKNDKLNNMVSRKKETNLAKSELDPAVTGSEDMYDFPSLTDLSFNSLAALKILQELNSEKVKPTTTCP